jgi:acyl-CoA thioesterase-1
MRRRCLLFLVPALFVIACSTKPPEPPAPQAAEKPAEPVKPSAPVAPADPRPVIVAFGDSLSAGYGVDPGLSFPDFVQRTLDEKGLKFRVVNQGISGDTTSGGAARTAEAIRLQPAVVVLELGGNDGLRGLPLTATRANLSEMIDAFQAAGARVVLAGITLPRNYGPDYIREFESIYKDLAREKKVTLIPFLLEGVALNNQLMQGDGIHPNVEGNKRVAKTVMRYLEPVLKSL